MMKINDLQHKSIQRIYKQQQQNMKEGNKTRSDKMDISEKAKEIRELEQTLKEMPDIRREKVDEIKQKLAHGDYEIEVEAVAAKILGQDIEQE